MSFQRALRALTRVSPQAAPLSADRRIGLLGGGGHCTLRRFRSGYHFINADHEGVLDGSRLRMEKNRLARSTSAFCKLVSAAAGACVPTAFLKRSLDQADTRVVASPAAAVCSCPAWATFS